jgi:hypothetical protein
MDRGVRGTEGRRREKSNGQRDEEVRRTEGEVKRK